MADELAGGTPQFQRIHTIGHTQQPHTMRGGGKSLEGSDGRDGWFRHAGPDGNEGYLDIHIIHKKIEKMREFYL